MTDLLPTPKLVIFDCDGTLVDTETLHMTVEAEVLREYGPAPSVEELTEMFMGQTIRTSFIMMRERFGWPEDTEEAIAVYMDRFKDALLATGDTIAVPGALRAMQDAAHRCHVAVATNGEVDFTTIKLQTCGFYTALPGLKMYTKDLVKRPKPAPDIYLYTAIQFGVEPKDCWVVEDSPVGVAAGVAAGMTVIGYIGCAHDKAAMRQALLNAGAAQVIADYADFPLEEDKRLIA